MPNTQGIKWFPTLAEAFSKLLEPKPLTVDDLIEGDLFWCYYRWGSYNIYIMNYLIIMMIYLIVLKK